MKQGRGNLQTFINKRYKRITQAKQTTTNEVLKRTDHQRVEDINYKKKQYRKKPKQHRQTGFRMKST